MTSFPTGLLTFLTALVWRIELILSRQLFNFDHLLNSYDLCDIARLDYHQKKFRFDQLRLEG